ncbi:MAG: leucyl/phenylalanyl-tRNA--protein transferase [Planctomycetaceae bacterium]|nr:leucyl/phenylalanyl-tRNA--protein transferase [Planctomycetaceae bacterium]
MSRLPPSRFFPPAETAGPEGLLAVGGELTPAWLLDSYRHGVFPWPVRDVLAWWSPDPRAIIELDRLHVPRRLARTLAGARFRVTCDRDFAGVLAGCATAQLRTEATWLTPPLRAAFERMHALGYAHSVEVWQGDELVGGTYGLALGAMFAAESMFYRARDASKVALVNLVEHLRARGYLLLDIQQLTPHTARFGAIEIPRADYLRRLDEALRHSATFGRQLETGALRNSVSTL